MDKKTIFVISDHIGHPSGVAHQTREFIHALLQTGRYRFVCLGGGVKHNDYRPSRTEEWGDDLIIYPVDGYGTPDIVRSTIRTHRPDVLWYMTDPRYFAWLHQIADEILPLMPMVWYTIWDNYPAPLFNKPGYDSNSVLVCISKLTYDVVKEVSPKAEVRYLPHAVNTEVFRKLPVGEMKNIRSRLMQNEDNPERMLFFWNSRNALRKKLGTTIYYFKQFLDIIGHENAGLILHTEPKDPMGQDIIRIMADLGLTQGQIILSHEKVPQEALAHMYNIASCTISISQAEGHGLSITESLACETPVIVSMTGGLQSQVTDGQDWFGIGLEPVSKPVVGSQEVPYIFDDHVSEQEFVDSLVKFYNMSAAERAEMGRKGREHVLKNFSFNMYKKEWINLMDYVVEKYGSWKTRKHYQAWELQTL